jgi:phenylacetate-CoA ligase
MNVKLWNETAETLQGQALKDLQLEKLKKLLLRVYEKSPYYKEKFDKAGVNPYEFTSLEQYQDYPFFDKYEERESQAQSKQELGHPLGMHITCDIREVNRMSASSGTTGAPSFQGHTKSDREIQLENSSRFYTRSGLKPGDRVLYAGEMSMWVAGIPAIDALLNFGANVIPIGAHVGSIKVAEMARLTRPDAIVCTPSFALHMLKKVTAETDIDLTDVGIRRISVYGEPGGSVPEVIKQLSEGFGGAEVYDLAGGTSCLNPIFASCEAHDGMHFIAPDHAYIEILDPETGAVLPIENGVEGEFVYTGLDRECGPLIRFKDGDRMQVNTEPCSCGMPGWRVKIKGRVDDMLLVKGVNVFPSAIQDLVRKMSCELTGNMRIVKFSDSPVIEPPLRLKVECVGGPSPEVTASIKAAVEHVIQRTLRFKAEVEMFSEGDLKMEYGATGKVKLIEKAYEA